MHRVANRGLSVAGSIILINRVCTKKYLQQCSPGQCVATDMFRRLGYPWALQVSKVIQEAAQWQDVKYDMQTYEFVSVSRGELT